MSNPGSSSLEIGGLSGFSTGAVWPSGGAGPVRSVPESFCAAANRLIPRIASSTRIIRFVAIVSFVSRNDFLLRDNNRVSRLQQEVLIHLFALHQFAIVNAKLLLLAVLYQHSVDLIGV